MRLTLNAQEKEAATKGATVIIPGYVSGEMEVDRWASYEVNKIYSNCRPDTVKVVDPEDHPHPGIVTDKSKHPVLPGEINGIPREPTGLGWDPLAASALPSVQIRWTLPDVTVNDQPATGMTAVEGPNLSYRIQISGPAVVGAARLASEDVKLRIEIVSNQDPTKVQTKGTEVQVQRSVFVQAASKGE